MKRKLVLIEWVDSHYNSGWTRDLPAEEVLICYSVGWLVYDGKKTKILVANITAEDEPQQLGHISIPVCAIRKIKKL